MMLVVIINDVFNFTLLDALRVARSTVVAELRKLEILFFLS